MSEFLYSLERPPVILAVRKERFTCSICGLPGWGAPNARVHGGACARQHARDKARKSAEKRKRMSVCLTTATA